MRIIHNIREGYEKAHDIWADRDQYIALAKEVFREAPGRFREAPSQTKWTIAAVVISILGLQAALAISLL